MDESRWANLVAMQGAYGRGEARIGSFPREAFLEVSARCNLRCIMCPITVDTRYRPGSGRPAFLEPSLFERLAPSFRHLQRAHLFGLGEPMLSPHLLTYARRLAENGAEVWTTTNGTLIDDSRAAALARAGLARVSVTLDAATAETYSQIRRGGRFEDALGGVRALGRARRLYGRPAVAVSMVGMAKNLPELPQLVELAAEAGAEDIFVELLHHFGEPHLVELYRRESALRLGRDRVLELLEAGRSRAQTLGVGFASRIDENGMDLMREAEDGLPEPAAAGVLAAAGGSRTDDPQDAGEATASGTAPLPLDPLAPSPLRVPWPCSEPWSTINVSSAGEVRTCCFNDTIMGELSRSSFDEIWNGHRYVELRRQHASGRSVASCDGCVTAGRIKRSPFLLPPAGHAERAAPPPRSAGGGTIEFPLPGELVTGPLIVVGTLPRPSLADRVLRLGEASLLDLVHGLLPEIFLNDGHLARQTMTTIVDGRRFAVVADVGYVVEGSYRLDADTRVGRPWGSGAAPVIQVGKLEVDEGPRRRPSGMPVAGVRQCAIAVDLPCHASAPTICVDGSPWSPRTWVCGRHGRGWGGVAVLDIAGLRPGRHALELRLDEVVQGRWTLVKLALPGAPSVAVVEPVATAIG